MINADQELSFPKGQGQQVKGQGQVCIWAVEKKNSIGFKPPTSF